MPSFKLLCILSLGICLISFDSFAQTPSVKRPFGTPKSSDSIPNHAVKRPFGNPKKSTWETYSKPDSVYFLGHRPNHEVQLSFFADFCTAQLSYTKLVYVEKHLMLAGKIGLGRSVVYEFFVNRVYNSVPHHLTANIGGNGYYFELGYGGTQHLGLRYQPYGIVGYHYTSFRSRFNFRLTGCIPLSASYYETKTYSPLGLSFGASF